MKDTPESVALACAECRGKCPTPKLCAEGRSRALTPTPQAAPGGEADNRHAEQWADFLDKAVADVRSGAGDGVFVRLWDYEAALIAKHLRRLAASNGDVALGVLASLGHTPKEDDRCRARVKPLPPEKRPPGPVGPPIFCCLKAGHEGQHRCNHGGMSPSFPFRESDEVEFGEPITTCAKCRIAWPCPEARAAIATHPARSEAAPEQAAGGSRWVYGVSAGGKPYIAEVDSTARFYIEDQFGDALARHEYLKSLVARLNAAPLPAPPALTGAPNGQ